MSAELGPEEGGGPPAVLPWTLVVADEGWEADLEHGAVIPRVGERIEYIADDGAQRQFEVTAVVHTVQHTSSERPLVREEQSGPNAVVAEPHGARPTILRAGLPRVFARAVDDASIG
jgi:hypothetical protein